MNVKSIIIVSSLLALAGIGGLALGSSSSLDFAHAKTSLQEQIVPEVIIGPREAPSLQGGDDQTAPEGDVLEDKAVLAASRLRDAVIRIDPGADLLASGANFAVQGVRVTLIYDLNSDRMRIVTPVASVNDVTTEEIVRLMQANFDSALDARYALAQGAIWSTFIHPLSSLSLDDFASGLGQTVNLALTYGSSYSSGALVFGGGDSQVEQEQRELIDELQDKSREI